MKKTTPSMPGKPQAALQAAARHLQRGELAAAERACRVVLDAVPKEAEALHLLGLVAHRGGDLATASSWQVRQGLYRRAIGRWRHYEHHLGPLLSGLGPMAPEAGNRSGIN